MADILKGVAGTASVFVFAWIFPCALALGIFALFLMPSLQWIPKEWQLSGMDLGKASLILTFASVALGLLLSGLETPLYRLLEGYAWRPAGLRTYGVGRERRRRQRLRTRLADLGVRGQQDIGWEQTLIEERLGRFPLDDQDIAPTRLGNALRAFETYGWNRFNLDSQTLWTELLTVVSDALRKELDQSRAAVDFLVCLVYLSVAYGLVALSGLLGRGGLTRSLLVGNWDFIAVGVGSFVLARLLYLAAVGSSSYWYSTVQALVNVGRGELAEQMGLRMPTTLEEERTMWVALSNLIIEPYSDRAAKALDPFRMVPAQADPLRSPPPSGGFLAWLRGRH